MAIFTLQFKTPDVLDQIDDDMICDTLVNDDEYDHAENASGHFNEQLKAFARAFVRYDEYLTVEFDTVKGTATVRPVGR